MAEKSKKSISRFLHSIDKCAKREEIRLADELEKLEEENWKKEEVKIIENTRFLMMSELASIKNKISMSIYNVRLNFTQKIFLRKKEIEEEIFDICKTDIENFVETDEYKSKLKDSIAGASASLGGSLDIFARREDVDYLNSISNDENRVFETQKIKYGGLIFCKDNVVLDDTFDTRMQEQRKWFIKYCVSKLV